MVGFFQSFPLSALPFHPPQFILQERYDTKKPLKWIIWEILPLANNKAHFFFLNLQITDLVVTKSYNSFFFFPAVSVSDVLFECSW